MFVDHIVGSHGELHVEGAVRKVGRAIRADFGQILEDNIYDLAGGVPQPVDVRIYGEDQSLLQQVKYVELTQIISRAKASKVTAGGSSASLGVAIVLGALIGIALALLSYVVFPARRSEA